MKRFFLPSFKELKKKYPLNASQKKFIDYSKHFCQDIFQRSSNKLIVITGPCSIHDETETLLYADKLKSLQKDLKNIFLVMRVFFEKPRSQNTWKGLLYDPGLNNTNDIINGIIKVRKLLLQLTTKKIPIATELLDPNLSNYFDDLISWGLIGARTSASTLHRHVASSLSIPIGFKNSLDGDVDIAINAAIIAKNSQNFVTFDENGKICHLESSGNKFAHIVLRGSKTEINYDKKSLDQVMKKMKDKMSNFNIVIDCSHGNSPNSHFDQIKAFRYLIQTYLEKKYPIIALMLESNLKDGKQKLSPLNLRFGLSITDPCINFETTKELILDADQNLNKQAPLLS